MRIITYCEALNEAMMQEMERDPNIFVYGIGVADHKRVFGSTINILERFGPERCFDTPIAEDSMTGLGLGAAINGLRPIHVHIRVDFLLLAMNQLANTVSSFRYGSGGKLGAPLVIRAVVGRGWHILVLYAFYGVYYGLAYGTTKAMVADLVPANLRGTAYGTHNAVLGILDFPASLIAGFLWGGVGTWKGFGPSAPFFFGAALSLIAALLMASWKAPVCCEE